MNYKDNLTFKSKFYRGIFYLVWGLLKVRPSKSFNFLGIYLLKIFGAKIGKKSTVYSSVKIWDPRNLIIENNVTVGPNVNLYSVNKIFLRNGCQISQDVNLITASHDFNRKSHDLICKPIDVGENVWIAANASVLMGVKIGRNAVIGFGSVVSKNVSENQIVVGNPQLLKGYRDLN